MKNLYDSSNWKVAHELSRDEAFNKNRGEAATSREAFQIVILLL